MSTIYLLHNNRCTKSRNAIALLEEQGQSYEVVPYLDGVLDEKNLEKLLDKLKLKPESIVRKTESIYKEKFKGKVFNDSEWIKILVKYPKLIERPIVYDDTSAIVGRPTENVLEFLKNRK